MRKILVVFFLSLLVFSCSGRVQDKKKNIVTTVFPLYDFLKSIKSDNFEIRLLLPPGAEVHSFDPVPKDMILVANADLFVYIGKELEPWAIDLVQGAELPTEKIFSILDQIPLPDTGSSDETDLDHTEANHDEEEFDDGHDHLYGRDPHIWLDFSTDIQIVNALARRLIEIDPKNSREILEKCAAYAEQLRLLDIHYKEMINGSKRKTVIFAGHNAFGVLGKKYGIEFISPYEGFSPDAEPSAMKIKELVDRIYTTGATVIYHEELIDPKLAEVLSKETSVKTVLLNAAHNIGKKDSLENSSFLNIMEKNFVALKEGLY